MAKYPIKVGATLTFEIQRVSNDEPIDLTGYIIESFLKHPKFGTFELEIEMVNAEEGQHRVVLDADTSGSLVPADYMWDIAYTHPSGKVEVFPKTNDEVILQFSKGATK